MCGLGCYYDAGVGVLVFLKEQDDLLMDAMTSSRRGRPPSFPILKEMARGRSGKTKSTALAGAAA